MGDEWEKWRFNMVNIFKYNIGYVTDVPLSTSMVNNG
jgi:hypothetical protein